MRTNKTSNPVGETREGYMCMTEFMLDMEGSYTYGEVYTDLSILERRRPCTEHCGIVKVRVTAIEVIQQPED